MPEERSSELPTLSCEEAGGLMRVYVASELEAESTRRLRAHLARCPACMQSYREAVATAAALSRMTGAEREKRMRERQRNARHAAAFGRDPSPEPRRRSFRLRMVLIPAVAIYVLVSLANLGPQPGRVELVEASRGVTIDERPANLERGPSLVLPGRWVVTERFANAALDARTCELHLGGATELLVESARPLRFRLQTGVVSVVGSATFVTVLGILEVEDARGRLSMNDHGLTLEPESGGWIFLDSDGSHELELGRAQSFGLQL